MTTALWTTDNSELYCNALYTVLPLTNWESEWNVKKKIVIVVGILGTILGAAKILSAVFRRLHQCAGSRCAASCGADSGRFLYCRKGKEV